jgi:hypothetical protein
MRALIRIWHRSPLTVALIAALPIEVANFYLVSFPIDTGLEPNTAWDIKVIAYQWLYIHLPGFLLIRGMQDSEIHKVGNLILFVGGYLDTAVLIFLGLLLSRWWERRSQRTTDQ